MKILNRNLFLELTKHEAFKIGKKLLIVPIIQAPQYYCQGIPLNEYTIRSLQVEISKGNIEAEQANALKITDENGQELIFRADGLLHSSPAGFDLNSRYAFELLTTNKTK